MSGNTIELRRKKLAYNCVRSKAQDGCDELITIRNCTDNSKFPIKNSDKARAQGIIVLRYKNPRSVQKEILET